MAVSPTTLRDLPRIDRVEAWALVGRLSRPWGPDVRGNHIVVVRVTMDDGSTGEGFSWTPSVGGGALVRLILDDAAPVVVGRRAHPLTVSRALLGALHEGGTGLVNAASAGIDLALWDHAARSADLSLVDHIGRERDSAPVYGSGVNLHLSEDDLVAQVQRWVDAGYGAIKVKVGKPDPAEDRDRLSAVREALGPQRRLMVDANQRWDLATAVRAVRSFDPFDIEWIEEPLRADDTAGYARLRARIDVPVALGENVHTVHRFRDLIEADACDVLQPNIVRVGGISPFLGIVALAEASSMPVAPHLLPDLSAQLALTLPRESWVEDVEDAGLHALGVLAEPSPVDIAAGRATVARRRGLGLRFTPDSEEDS